MKQQLTPEPGNQIASSLVSTKGPRCYSFLLLFLIVISVIIVILTLYCPMSEWI